MPKVSQAEKSRFLARLEDGWSVEDLAVEFNLTLGGAYYRIRAWSDCSDSRRVPEADREEFTRQAAEGWSCLFERTSF